jgi:tetratricopeptide (TPR) repeat protein
MILFTSVSAFFIFMSCSQRPVVHHDQSLDVTVIYVNDEHYPAVSRDRFMDWVSQSQQFYQQQTNTHIMFTENGAISIHDFIGKYYAPLKKDPELEVYRLSPTPGAFKPHKQTIVSILSRQDLAALNRVSFPYTNRMAHSYEDLYAQITDQYALSLQRAKQMQVITVENYTYRSEMNWTYILRNIHANTLLVTNAPVFEDVLDPFAFYRHASGAFSFGFSVPGRGAVVSTFLYAGESAANIDHIMPLAITHEIGHALFFLEDTLEDSGSPMSLQSASHHVGAPLSSFHLTDQEKHRVRAALLIHQGNDYVIHGSLEKAIDAYQQAVTVDPNSGQAYSVLASAYVQAHKYADADRILEKALQVQPGNYQLYDLWGDLLWTHPELHEKGLTESIKLYEKALEINPFSIGSRLNLAYGYQNMGDTEKAIEAYQIVLGMEPTNVTALEQLGGMYSHQGDCPAMMKVYDQLVTIDAKYAESYYRLGVCLEGHDRHKADTYFRKYLELEPSGDYSEIVKGYLAEKKT